jgi:hypothetical protein
LTGGSGFRVILLIDISVYRLSDPASGCAIPQIRYREWHVTIAEDSINIGCKIVCLTELVCSLGDDLNREGAKNAKGFSVGFSRSG